MNRRRVIVWVLAVLIVVGAMVVTGLILNGRSASSTGGSATTMSRSANEVSGLSVAPTPSGVPASPGGVGAGVASGATDQSAKSSTGPMIVVTSSMNIQVKDIQSAVQSVREAAAAAGGTVSDLSITSGTVTPPEPRPLGAAGSSTIDGQPSSANMTLRIPVAKLEETQRRLAKLGDVTSQSSSASDVTQQHIDMAARLKNLQAEEVRLRQLLDRAGSVSDLLEVERELARVRGDIESLQAQLAYLENEAAMGTLVVNLTQPGALVRPASATWGLADAITLGVQSAVALVRAFITGIVALSPVLLVALIGWIVWRVMRSRHTVETEDEPEDQGPDAS